MPGYYDIAFTGPCYSGRRTPREMGSYLAEIARRIREGLADCPAVRDELADIADAIEAQAPRLLAANAEENRFMEARETAGLVGLDAA